MAFSNPGVLSPGSNKKFWNELEKAGKKKQGKLGPVKGPVPKPADFQKPTPMKPVEEPGVIESVNPHRRKSK